jgi:hypothetical protein
MTGTARLGTMDYSDEDIIKAAKKIRRKSHKNHFGAWDLVDQHHEIAAREHFKITTKQWHG